MKTHECRWVRPRLALLAGDPSGGDLPWDDRRRVERHLIGCGPCRSRRSRLERSVGMLREAGSASPVAADAPSIWPALSRQIRGSRHPRPAPWFAAGFGPSLGLAAGLLVAGIGIGQFGGRVVAPSSPRPRPSVRAATLPRPPRPALPDGPAQVVGPVQAPPEPRLDLDPKAADPRRAVGQ